MERLDLSRTYVFMPNHASFLDILLVLAFIPHNFRFLVKEEFFSIPFLGLTMRAPARFRSIGRTQGKACKASDRGLTCLKRVCQSLCFRKAHGALMDKSMNSRARSSSYPFGQNPWSCPF